MLSNRRFRTLQLRLTRLAEVTLLNPLKYTCIFFLHHSLPCSSLWYQSGDLFFSLCASLPVCCLKWLQNFHNLFPFLCWRQTEEETDERITILPLIWLWKQQQIFNSYGICSNLSRFNDERITHCQAEGFRCHMSTLSRAWTGQYINGGGDFKTYLPSDRQDWTQYTFNRK